MSSKPRLRRMMAAEPRATMRLRRAHHAAARVAPLPPQKRAFAWWPAVLMDWNFAPAWPRVAALAGAAVLGISIGLSSLGARIAADLDLVRVAAADDAAATCSMSIDGVAPMTMTIDDAGPLLALAADRLARAQSVLHRHDRRARGAPLRGAGAAGRDRAAAHRRGAHRAARRAAAGGGCRETARGVPARAKPRPKARAKRSTARSSASRRRCAREPFDAAQLRAALAEVRAARPAYELVMQEIYSRRPARCRPRAAQARRLAGTAHPNTR